LPSSVGVRFISVINNEHYGAGADDVRPVPNTDLTQVVVTLPFTGPGTFTVTMLYRSSVETNSGTIRIVP